MSPSAQPNSPLALAGIDPSYAALRDSAVWMADDQAQIFELSGEERSGFLNSYNTQDIKSLSVNRIATGAFLTQKGKLVSEVRILNLSARLLLIFPAGFGDKVAQHLATYLMFAKVTLENATERWAHFAVLGPKAESFLPRLFPQASPAQANAVSELVWEGSSVYLFPSSGFGAEGWEILLPAALGPTFREQLQKLPDLLPLSEAARETARIEAGIPKMGVDMGADNLVAEVGLDSAATSFNKGCYLGQETTARVQSRGHVNRRLTPVRLAAAYSGNLPADIFQGEKRVGVLTSAAESPKFGSWIGLGTVALNAWEHPEEKAVLTNQGRISIQKL